VRRAGSPKPSGATSSLVTASSPGPPGRRHGDRRPASPAASCLKRCRLRPRQYSNSTKDRNNARHSDFDTASRIPPQNVELEQALLGAVLINNDALHRVSDFLKPVHFAEPVHRRIFELCVELIGAGKTATPITLKTFLPSDIDVAGLTISQYLARLAAEATTVINAADYGHEIRELAARRDIIAAGEDLIEAGHEPGGLNSRMIATGAIERMDEIVAVDGRAHKTRFTIGEAADDAITHIAALMQNPNQRTVTWGLCELDKMAPVLEPGNLVVFAGRPGMGKTGVVLSSMVRAARKGFHALFFNLEMTARSLTLRALTDIAYDYRLPISYSDAARGKIENDEYDRIEDARRILETLPIVIEEQPALSVSQIAARTRKEQQRLERQGAALDIVVVDHVHIMAATNRYAGARVHEVSEISAGLKALAKELHIPVLALAQLNRAVEGRDNRRPELRDLRDSGSIEQDADAVIFAYRPEYYLEKPCDDPGDDVLRQESLSKVRHCLELNVAKQRNGPTGTVHARFDAACNHLDDLTT
jgi:replicative DNA helicase